VSWPWVRNAAAPAEAPPHYGLDHEFSVDDDEFLATMAGRQARCSCPEPDRPVEQRRPVLSGDAPRHRTRQGVDHDRGYIYWAGEIGLTFARALAAKSRAGVKVKILLDAVGAATVGDEILKVLEAGGCQVAWYNPLRWYTTGALEPSHAPQVAHRRWARGFYGRRGHC